MPKKIYLRNPFKSKIHRLNGLIRSKRLPNNAALCQSFCDHMTYDVGTLPPKVDLREEMTPVEDQSTIGSCVANSLAGTYEYLIKKATGEHIDVSRLFIYYNARLKDRDLKS
ncbi:unnamed protein product, partial [Rotaria magnacalcarata]